MNININIAPELVERLTFALERLANAAERIAGPIIPIEEPKPFDPTLWMESSNALSRQIEEEDRQEAIGYGPTYQSEIEERARTAQRPPNGLDPNA
jgi:hypothetical protein